MKRKMNLKPLLLFALLIGLIACVKNPGQEKRMRLQYSQTSCADPWGYANDVAGTIRKIKLYLHAEGMGDARMEVRITRVAEPDLCYACTCRSGNLIQVSLPYSAELLRKYEQAGFTEEVI